MDSTITLHEGKYLGLYIRGNWEFARRPNADCCVGILPITDQGELVLVEQFRIPVQKSVIEIPAGLVGDEPEFSGESLAESAGRELLEETGYRAGAITHLMASPTSAGMTPEVTHLFAATKLTKEHEGGGVAGEDIKVHLVPVETLPAFLNDQLEKGLLIDFKIHAALQQARFMDII
ncbi:hypothetical protein Rhal01_01868 [Rubritalea halochordaticola]|uniref:GDP-mannose pyrophosphatase n=1 Tax=Rubritalea halochordaticola TaxID=714537 RepID=A0ABP9UZ09_9BACT